MHHCTLHSCHSWKAPGRISRCCRAFLPHTTRSTSKSFIPRAKLTRKLLLFNFLKIKFNRITPGSGSSWEAKLRAESRYWSAQNECGSGILRWNFSYGAEGYTAVHFSFYMQYLVFSYGAEGYTAVHFSFLHAVFSLLPPVKSYKIPSLVFNSVKQFEPSVNKKAHM